MTSSIFCTLAILYFFGNRIATAVAFPTFPSYGGSGDRSLVRSFLEKKILEKSGDRSLGSHSTHDTNQLINDLEEIAGEYKNI